MPHKYDILKSEYQNNPYIKVTARLSVCVSCVPMDLANHWTDMVLLYIDPVKVDNSFRGGYFHRPKDASRDVWGP